MEALFGSASPTWTGIVPSGFAFPAPLPVGHGPIATPLVSPNAGAPLAIPPAPHPNTYGYTPGVVAFAPNGLSTLTASSLLMAIAVRRGQPNGPSNDQEVEDFIYDALELLAGASDVEVRCEGGRVTLTGTVQHKRLKHDVGEIAWAIPALHDVQNNVTIASKRRTRAAGREGEAAPSAQGRKQG
jgi:hypothetical protein